MAYLNGDCWYCGVETFEKVFYKGKQKHFHFNCFKECAEQELVENWRRDISPFDRSVFCGCGCGRNIDDGICSIASIVCNSCLKEECFERIVGFDIIQELFGKIS